MSSQVNSISFARKAKFDHIRSKGQLCYYFITKINLQKQQRRSQITIILKIHFISIAIGLQDILNCINNGKINLVSSFDLCEYGFKFF